MPIDVDEIKQYLEFEIVNNPAVDNTPSSSGFYQLVCPSCRKHRKAAGFKFEIDKIIYQCFRGTCDATTVYEYGKPMYKKFRNILNLLNIEIPLNLKLSPTTKNTKTFDENLYESHTYNKIILPSNFEKFNRDKHRYFADYLDRRCATFDTQLYVGKEDAWKNRLIIPFYYNGELIGWQGVNEYYRSMPYLNSSGNTDLLYINNGFGHVPKIPILVEGIFDASVLPNGVGTLHSSVSKKQAYILRHSQPILVPDRKGSKYIDVAKKYGWRLSIPAWKVKDVNDAVQTYGIFVTTKMIHDGIQSNILTAEAKYRMWKLK